MAVLTYHYDNSRSGWNNTEAKLTPATVASTSFGIKHTVVLDDQVDGQPLVVPGLTTVGGNATNGDDVVYVATENDTVYAIDGATGAILESRHLGTPIQNPLGCHNNGTNVGVNSTPAIDIASKTIYVMTYADEGAGPIYRLHALDIVTLADKATTLVTASHSLVSGKSYVFDPTVQRQRAALLFENGNIYASFASFCDSAADKSRGWILGWSGSTLAPLAGNQLNNTQETGQFYLSSIWMSGSGLASYNGNIVAVTGNSNPNGATYDAAGGTNFAESIIKVSPDLSKVVDWFTPTNFAYLESVDYDFGAGGVVVIPNAFGSVGIAAAAGKDGTMYVVNMDNLGHGGPAGASPAPLGTAPVGFCWCAESYFVGQHGPTIVSSGGGNGQLGNGESGGDGPTEPELVQLWSLPGSLGANAPLSNVGQSTDLSGTSQDAGFFTSVSSLGSNNAIIWALTRPDDAVDANGNHPMTLYAFSETLTGGKLTQLFKGVGGVWGDGSMGGNSNIVPVVANGRVYVATYQQLEIFGLS